MTGKACGVHGDRNMSQRLRCKEMTTRSRTQRLTFKGMPVASRVPTSERLGSFLKLHSYLETKLSKHDPVGNSSDSNYNSIGNAAKKSELI